MKTQQVRYFDFATVPGPKPGDFPVGSVQSRAAARAILEGYAEAQCKEVQAELANLNPFEQAVCEMSEDPLVQVQLYHLACIAEERAAVYGTQLLTPEQARHAREVTRLADELAGGRLSELSVSNPDEEKRWRALAEENLKNTRPKRNVLSGGKK